MFRRTILFSLILVMLAGCAGLELGTKSEPVTLHFSFAEYAADYQPLADEFHRQHPNITVELDPLKNSRDVAGDLAGKADTLDAARVPASAVSEQLAKAFLPLDSMISASQDFPQKDLFPGSLEALKVDGKQIAIPAGLNPFVVFYSPKKFSDAGIQPPSPGWTLEDFVVMAKAINNTDEMLRGTDKFMYGYCSSPALFDSALFTYLFGGGLFDSLTTVSQPTLNQRANVDAISWYASLSSDYHLLPEGISTHELGTYVARGNCGFWIDWLNRAIFGQYRQDSVAPLPLPAFNDQFNVSDLDAYFIFNTSQHPEETWQWLTFLLSQQTASGRLIPPLKSSVASEGYAARVSPQMLSVARSLPSKTVVLGMEMYRNQRFGKVIELFGAAITKVMSGEVDAQTALDLAQQEAEAVFK